MKIKKLITPFLIISALCLSFAFAACGDENSGGDSTSGGNTDNGQTSDGGTDSGTDSGSSSSDSGDSTATLSYTLAEDGDYYVVKGDSQGNITSLEIPSTYESLPVAEIASNAFENWSALTSVTIPDSVKTINDEAFYGCTALADITVGDSVTRIGDCAFYNTAYYNDSANWQDGALYLENYLLKADTSISGSYAIKDGTLVIADNALYECVYMKNVTIPDSVVTIGASAFNKCDLLVKVAIPNSVTYIGAMAFYNCWYLDTITIGDNVEYIGGSAFKATGYYDADSSWTNGIFYIGNYLLHADTDYFGSYAVNDGTLIIADGAFSKCDELQSITIPDSVKTIGAETFRNCSSLTDITIGGGVNAIYTDAFYRCTALKNITVDSDNTAYKSVDGNLYTYDGTTLVQYAIGKADTAFTIPDGVTEIYVDSFANCTSLTSVIV